MNKFMDEASILAGAVFCTIILFVVLGFVFAFPLAEQFERNKKYNEVFYFQWNTRLGDNFEEVYRDDCRDDFLGNKYRYTVLRVKDINNSEDLRDKATEQMDYMYERNINRVAEIVGVKEEYMVNYNHKLSAYYKCIKTDTEENQLFVVYDKKDNLVYIAESLENEPPW